MVTVCMNNLIESNYINCFVLTENKNYINKLLQKNNNNNYEKNKTIIALV